MSLNQWYQINTTFNLEKIHEIQQSKLFLMPNNTTSETKYD